MDLDEAKAYEAAMAHPGSTRGWGLDSEAAAIDLAKALEQRLGDPVTIYRDDEWVLCDQPPDLWPGVPYMIMDQGEVSRWDEQGRPLPTIAAGW